MRGRGGGRGQGDLCDGVHLLVAQPRGRGGSTMVREGLKSRGALGLPRVVNGKGKEKEYDEGLIRLFVIFRCRNACRTSLMRKSTC